MKSLMHTNYSYISDKQKKKKANTVTSGNDADLQMKNFFHY